MVYSQKLVACVKVNGQILREDGGQGRPGYGPEYQVTVPFGSEYSLYLKNLNSVRVQVKVSVDSQDATEGTWLVIQPNSSIELERFIKNGNLNRGNRFKFVERTSKIEKHRGIGGEDGLIRIEYQTEKILPKPIVVPVVHYDYWYRPYWWPQTFPPSWWGTTYTYGGVQYVCNNAPAQINLTSLNGQWQNSDMSSIKDCDNVTYTNTTGGLPTSGVFLGNLNPSNVSYTANNMSLGSTRSSRLTKSAGPTRSLRSMGSINRSVKIEENDAGITVPGSESSQQFHWTSSFPVHETSDVIVLKLRGSVGGLKVSKAVTVKTKPVCRTCGKKNRATVKFCAECGTALSIL